MAATIPLIDTRVTIAAVRIRNFRSLRCIDVELDELTVLIGQNNAGKTSFIDAVCAAIGATRRSISPEDIYLDYNEATPPRDRQIIVDILIKPCSNSQIILDKFPAGSPWIALWGEGISQETEGNFSDFVAIRTKFAWDESSEDYILER